MLNVIYAECPKQALSAEFHDAEYPYADCRYVECSSALYRYLFVN
jgi:hypothetical protein